MKTHYTLECMLVARTKRTRRVAITEITQKDQRSKYPKETGSVPIKLYSLGGGGEQVCLSRRRKIK